MNILLLALIFSVGFNVAMFIPAFIYKTDQLTDISYSLTFIFLAIFGFTKSSRQNLHTLLLIMVLAWATRLGGFLFMRIRHMKVDKRFDEMRGSFSKFLRFWLLQAVTVTVVLTSYFLATKSTSNLTSLSLLGVIIFAIGLLTEATADAQKFKFNKTNKSGSWIDTGIWRATRHPNYLGEMMVWVGVYLTAFSSLSNNHRVIALASPLFIISLLMFVSGVPLLEKAADKKWGSQKDYQEYKKSVPVMIPSPKSIARALSC